MDTKSFEIKMTHSMDEFHTLAKLEYNSKAKGMRYVFLLGCLLLIGIGIFAIIKLGFSVSALIMILAGLLIPFFNVRLVHRIAKMMAKQAGDFDARIIYTLDEDGLSIRDKNGDRTIGYEELERVVETKAYFYIYLKSMVCFCLPKADFRTGDPRDFVDFLRDQKDGQIRYQNYPKM